MDFSRWLFWNVDTQVDFMHPKGNLYVKDAEKIRPALNKLTKLALHYGIRTVNTADFHFPNSAEIDTNPDFVHTFPPHCMAETAGANFIPETDPDEPLIFDWNREYLVTDEILDTSKHRNFVIRKDAFDVFTGSPWTKIILKMIKPSVVVVYGVTTNICVDFAVKGLAKRVKNTLVITDAIKELPGIALPFQHWQKAGVEMITLAELENRMAGS